MDDKKVFEVIDKAYEKAGRKKDLPAKLIESYNELYDWHEEHGVIDDELLYRVKKDLVRNGGWVEELENVKTYGSYIY